MAKKLKAFPGNPPYDWDQWLDGSAWLLRKGEDYEIDTPSMRAAVSRAARARGKKARTRVMKAEDGAEALAIQALEA